MSRSRGAVYVDLVDKFDEFAATAPPRPPQAPGALAFYGERPLAGVQTTPPFRLQGEAGPAPPVFGAGNINLSNRPEVLNPDGSVSTVRSMSANIDGREVLMPTVSEDARLMSDDEAIQQYLKTGRNLGTFDSVDAANGYAKQLHERQSTLPVANPVPPRKGDRPGRKQASVPAQPRRTGKSFIDRIEDNGMAVLIDGNGDNYTTRNVPAQQGWKEGQWINARRRPIP